MIIVLTALHAELLSLPFAAALVIGADLGTTITVVLGSMSGGSEKKRVAAAHFIFNIVTSILALAALDVLLRFALFVVGDSRPLYALVFFQSSFNFLGIIIFWPFLGKFSQFLESYFITNNSSFLRDINPSHSYAAMESIKLEIDNYFAKVFSLNSIAEVEGASSKSTMSQMVNKINEEDYYLRYNELKDFESLILNYLIQIQRESLSVEHSRTLIYVLSGLRNAALSAKAIKDIKHNFDDFKKSSNDYVYNLSDLLIQNNISFLKKINQIVLDAKNVKLQDALILESILNSVEKFNKDFINKINHLVQVSLIPQKHISNLYNVNTEVLNSSKFTIVAVQEIYFKSSR